MKQHSAPQVKVYDVMVRAVEEGAAHGVRRAYKHTSNPSPEAIEESVVEEVLNSICEWFEFYPEGE
jgi:hypothetical protein